jgi:peptidoglycan DL-endopeptidase CwlO
VATTRTRTLRLAVVPVVAAAIALVLVPQTGQAQPQPTVAQVQAELATLGTQGEVAQENLNTAGVALAAGQRSLAQLQARVFASQSVVDSARLQVGRLASAAYRAGGVDQTLQLILADNPAQFLEQATALDGVARQQGDVLRAAAVAEQRLSQDKLAASQQVTALSKIQKGAEADYAQVAAAKRQYQDLLNSLQASARAQILASQKAASDQARAMSAQRSSRSGGHGYSGPYNGSIGQRVVQYALGKVGDAYVWGGSGPSAFDCSGLTMEAYQQVGISLPHSAAAQFNDGRQISAGSLEPGDLVFYYSPIHHVGIYIGGGMVVHAANPGAGVRTDPVFSMPFSGAVRPY